MQLLPHNANKRTSVIVERPYYRTGTSDGPIKAYFCTGLQAQRWNSKLLSALLHATRLLEQYRLALRWDPIH